MIEIKPFGPIAGGFLQANNRVDVIVGPVGSAKTTAACVRSARHAYEQQPDSDGIARVRVAVVRNTRRQLLDTTLKSWLQIFPEKEYGGFQHVAMTHRWQFKPRGLDHAIDAEFVFRALDDEADVSNLLSAEYTYAWFNEGREISEPIWTHMGRRVGRFPGSNRCTYFGRFSDTNPFSTEHFLYNALILDPRPGWKLHKQPGGLEPNAENIENLPGGREYYLEALRDYTPDEASIYVHAKYGMSRAGKPVYAAYNDEAHCKPVAFDKAAALLIGYDCSGQNPAAVVGQRTDTGQWLVLREFPGEDIGVKAHAEALKRYLADEFPGMRVERITCDPAGAAKDAHAQDNIRIIRDVFRTTVLPARTNDPRTRIEAVDGCFRRMINGGPAIMIDPKCKQLRMACVGEYKYRKLKLPGNQYSDEPQKLHPWSDLADSLQYLLLGGGEGRASMAAGGAGMSDEQFARAVASRKDTGWGSFFS